MKQTKQMLSMLLCCAMLLGFLPSPVFADDAAQTGLCEHHAEHVGCAYAPAVQPAECGHQHEDACYAAETVCTHIHEGCATEELLCEHVCTEETGCMTKTLNCQHIHDEVCGYAEAMDAVGCDYVCGECNAQEEIPVCDGTLDCAAEVHDETCAKMAEEETPVNAAATAGSWGNNLSWEVDEAGTLTISGTGEMLHYMDGQTDPSNPLVDGYPWHQHQDTITSVVVEEGVTSLAELAFRGMTNLSNVTLPDSLTTIGDAAFAFCPALESIEIPANVSAIGKEVFYQDNALKEISFAGDAPVFDPLAFSEVTLTAIFPALTPSWDGEVMMNYGGHIDWVLFGTDGSYGDTFYWQFDETTGTLTILGEGILYRRSADPLPWSAYYDQIQTVVIEDGLTVLGEDMFLDCPNMTQVTLPQTVTAISYHAFSDCTGLQQVNLPGSVESIHERAFQNCTSLKQISIPDSVQVIKEEAFRNCSNLTEVSLPAGVTEIAYATFADCTSLTEVTIPDTVTRIVYSAFDNCSSLTSISIPDSVQTINEEVFRNCSSLADVTLPNSILEIAYATFANCSSLTEITIPDSVTKITASAFDSCTGLQEIILPENVADVAHSAFYGCTGLTTLTAPVDLTGISNSAFEQCNNLTTVILPKKLDTVGTQAFAPFPNVTTVRFTGDAPAIAADGFAGVTTTAYYPTANTTWTEDLFQDYGGLVEWLLWITPGDADSDGVVDSNDAAQLLWHILNPTEYPLAGKGDVTGDGEVTVDDAVYVVWHTLFPATYPVE